jgi:hypothetical protein
MAQAKAVKIMTRPGCASVELEMFPEQCPDAVCVNIPSQYMSPAELRTVARLLEQAADRKEELFTVVWAQT